ncbi:MAG: hypothetical protein PVF17_03400 [Ignavibacteria bacterium]|jgi:hypothetical protein
MLIKTKILIFVVVFGLSISADEGPFTQLYSNHGFDVKFIYYSEGTGTRDNGVVILIVNRSKFKISYSFELVFRTPEKDKSIVVDGILNAGERRTGSEDNLYFLPFKDQSSISEVGIKKVKVAEAK